MPRALPRRAYVLLAALVTISVVVLGVVLWAQSSGRAGEQRGLVITNKTGQTATITLADGQSRTVEDGHGATFVVKREQFPSLIRAVGAAGALIAEKRFEYREFSDAEFRISVDTNGFYRTQELRDTPAPDGR